MARSGPFTGWTDVALDKITLLTDAEGALTLEARLAALDHEPPLATSRFLAPTGGWQVEALFEAPIDPARIASMTEGIPLLSPPAIEPVQEQNWVAHVEATLKPVAAGPFLVHGPHDRTAAAGHPHAIEIEAGGAFGTAHHATTQGCLAAIGQLMSGGPAQRILDLGTGSGILAIAAAKLSADAVILATDIDPESVRIAAENAAINGVVSGIRCLAAEGLAHPELVSPAVFDLILANILAEPLVALAPDLKRALAPGGRIVLSGLLATQQGTVLAAYEREGLRLLETWPIGEWMTMAVG
ncbi:MAG: 50S ribosomal protein L11 methyltransferase [Hyphomicrobiaceae bacterium]